MPLMYGSALRFRAHFLAVSGLHPRDEGIAHRIWNFIGRPKTFGTSGGIGENPWQQLAQ